MKQNKESTNHQVQPFVELKKVPMQEDEIISKSNNIQKTNGDSHPVKPTTNKDSKQVKRQAVSQSLFMQATNQASSN